MSTGSCGALSPRPWTHYRARLAGLARDPEGNSEEITRTRRLMLWARLRQRAVALSDDAAEAGLDPTQREEMAALLRAPIEDGETGAEGDRT